jgi:hypothetical protein
MLHTGEFLARDPHPVGAVHIFCRFGGSFCCSVVRLGMAQIGERGEHFVPEPG